MNIRTRFIIVLSFSTVFVSARTVAADWPTFGHYPQRPGWASEEKVITPESVHGLELKSKAKVGNEPRSLTAVTAPVVASVVRTPKGKKTLVYVGGSTDHATTLHSVR